MNTKIATKKWFETLTKENQHFVLESLGWGGSPLVWEKMSEEQQAHLVVFQDNYSEVVSN